MPLDRRRVRAAALAASLLLAAACNTDLTLPPASAPVATQQITLYALTGTPVYTNSAYDGLNLLEVRTDQTSGFDFAYDLQFDSAYGIGKPGDTVAVLIPRGRMGFVPDPGLFPLPGIFNFDSLITAPANTDAGWVKDSAVAIHEDDVLYMETRVQTCNFGFTLPHYAKLQIVKIDLVNRFVVIRLDVDPNCGYRSVGPEGSIPSQ